MTGSGNVITEARDVTGFNEIALSGSGTGIVTQGDEEALTIEAEDNLLPFIKSEVRGNRLMIYHENGLFARPRPTRPIRYHITVKRLNAVQRSGSGDLEAANIATDRLEVNVSGSGTVAFAALAADRLTSSVSGSGGLRFSSGRVNTQEASISGSGQYAAGGLESSKASVMVSGSGRATVHASDALSLHISGSGLVEYAGEPRVRQAVSGSGRVQRLVSERLAG